jgi:hypothetical protein
MDDTLTHAVKPLKDKATAIYQHFTIPTYVCYNMYYRSFDERAKEYFSELISQIDVESDSTSQGGLILWLGAPGTRFTPVNTPFCNALMGFYQLIIDIKAHNIGRVKIKYKNLHGGLEERTDKCLHEPGSYPGHITTMRDNAMSVGGSKTRRKSSRKTCRGHNHKSKSKSKTKTKTHRRRRAHHSRLRKHKKNTSRK